MIRRTDDDVEESSGCLALRFDGLPHAAAHVHQHGDGKRQIGVASEIPDFLLASIFANFEIFLAQIGDQSAALVGDSTEDVHHVDVYADGLLIGGLSKSLA